MEDFSQAEQKSWCINSTSGCWLLECLMCITFVFIFLIFNVRRLCIHFSEVRIWYSQWVSWKHPALGVEVQMFSIIQDGALKLRHLNTTTYFTAVLQQVALHSVQHYLNLLDISDSSSSTDHKVPSFFCVWKGTCMQSLLWSLNAF